MANIFDVYTISRLVETENTAGTESIAKIISEHSTRQSIANSGVKTRLPLTLTINFFPLKPSVIGRIFPTIFMILLS